MVHSAQTGSARAHYLQIRSGAVMLQGDLIIPAGAPGVVLFAHGFGSSRQSPRNQQTPDEEIRKLLESARNEYAEETDQREFAHAS